MGDGMVWRRLFLYCYDMMRMSRCFDGSADGSVGLFELGWDGGDEKLPIYKHFVDGFFLFFQLPFFL